MGRRAGLHSVEGAVMDRPSDAAVNLAWSYARGAPCNDIIKKATSTVDYDQRDGAKAAPCCPVLRDLYNAPEKHAEDIVSKVFGKHGLRLDVKLSYGKVGHDHAFPYITAESLVQTLERHGKLFKLLGFGREFDTLSKCGDKLEKFWSMYRPLHPTNEFFKLVDQGAMSPRCCVPIYFHGDEGTTYKKDGCLVLSIHSGIGAGTLLSQKLGSIRQNALGRDEPKLNFAGHAFETRFMLAAMLREDYRDNSEAYRQLLELVVRSVDEASRQGVRLRSGEIVYLIPLGNKGDWPYLATSANMNRSYRNVPKAGSSKKPCTGICHICLAGRPGLDYEDMSDNPPFLQTYGMEIPWEEEAVFTRVLMCEADKTLFHKIDLFHTVTLGVGKSYAASCLTILQELMPGSSIEERLRELSSLFLEYCREHGKTSYVQKIDRSLLGWIGSAEPTGGWSKGALTTVLCQFIEHLTSTRKLEVSQNEVLRRVASTCRALNYFMRKLYAGGLFIEGDLCGYIIDASTHFLRGYSWLAATCHNMGLARFPAMPKSHMLFHVRQFLMEQYNSFGYFENPIAASCSCDEDMIGRVCYLTRCVSPKTRIKRCYERYLTQVLLLMRRCN